MQLEKTSKELRGKLDFSAILGITTIHALALFAPWYFNWSGLFICIFFMWLSGWIGITLCYHRLLTHKSFATPQWFAYMLTLFGTLAWQGGPIKWVGNHRLHHNHPDTDDDPHTPNHGLIWSHISWTLHKSPADVNPLLLAKDLARDRVISLIDRFYWWPQLLLAIMLFLSGLFIEDAKTGFVWIVWGIGVRTVVVYHGTWFVNSAAHTWGYQNFKTGDRSTNNWWVAIFSGGEGWHNNHHAKQRSARHGMRWFEIDPTYWTIRLLSLVGLAWDIIEPNKAM